MQNQNETVASHEVYYKGELLDIEEIVNKIIQYRDENNTHYLTKFNVNFLISIIEKDKISQMERSFKEYDKKGVDIIDFVKIFLNIIEHQERETLYLVMALVELFRMISETLNMTSYIKLQDVTNFICESFGEKNNEDCILMTKKFPEQKKFNTSNKSIRMIDIDAPIVYGTGEELVRRLVKSKLITDSSHHNNQSIKMGIFAKEIKKVFTLDSLSDRINVYNLDCVLERTINSNQLKNKKDTIILSFAWSSKQQRLGAALKDFNLMFWDSSDSFKFQKSFNVSNYSTEYQTNIWYIEFLNIWLTTDKTNSVYGWDIETESLSFQIQHPKIKSSIIDVIEIPVMKLVAMASLDRILTIWDLYKKSIILTLDLSKGGIHSLIYFNTYQVLVTAGYENSISVYQINPFFYDHDLLGKLIGHNSMVTAIQCIEKTPLLISADDNGIIKVWDIRSFKCIQTIDVGSKTVITKLLDIQGFSKICFIGSRVNFLNFDEPFEIIEKKENKDEFYPIKVEYNYLSDELIVCTRKDLRFLDLNSGRIKKIYSGLLRKADDEITIFKSVDQHKKFVIGDHRGGLNMFLYLNGEKCQTLVGHSNEITSLKVDFMNKLFISAGWDSNLLIQKEESSKNCFEIKREIKNCFFNKEIQMIDVSVYHNIIITISNNKSIYLWDYEYCKLLGILELNEGVEPTCVSFINGFSLLLIGTTHCRIFIVHFELREQTIIFRVLGVIRLNKDDIEEQENENENEEKDNEKSVRSISRASMRASMLKSSSRSPDRVSRVSAITLSSLRKASVIVQSEDKSEEDYQEEMKKKTENKQLNTPNKILVDLDYESSKDVECIIFLSFLKGNVRKYDISVIFNKFNLEIVPPSNKRMNYNAFRQNKEEFISAVSKMNSDIYNLCSQDLKNNQNILQLDNKIKLNFQAHKESLTTLSLITLSKKCILTSSIDSFIKIWDLEGTRLASVNINHPLPISWNLQIDLVKRTRKNILFGLKIIELIFRRYKRAILLAEEKLINVNNFLSSLTQESNHLRFPSLKTDCTRNIIMRNEYSPRDMQFENIKNIYQRELMGPSLKEMESNKRVLIAQKMWKSEIQSNNDDSAQKLIGFGMVNNKYEDKPYKDKDGMIFFDVDFRNRLIPEMGDDEHCEHVQNLSKKLDTIIKKRKKNESVILAHSSKFSPNKKKHLKLPSLSTKDQINSESHKTDRERLDSISCINPIANKNKKILEKSKENNKDQTFRIYASHKNLLDSTRISNNNNSNYNLNQIHEKNNFHNILKSLDVKLKKSQIASHNFEYSRRSIDFTSILEKIDSPTTLQRKKRMKSEKNKTKKNTELDTSRSNNEQEIDNMISDIMKNVKEKAAKKLEVELTIRRKEKEYQMKKKILMEFKEIEKIKTEQNKIETKENGFISLNSMFQSVHDFKN